MIITEIQRNREPSNKPIRIAAYCRVSTNSEDQLHSFAAQLNYYRDYCKSHPNCVLVDIYADKGITGTSMEKRDQFMRMIKDCKPREVYRQIPIFRYSVLWRVWIRVQALHLDFSWKEKSGLEMHQAL